MEKQEVVAKIIEAVGGKDNIQNAWHCMTRLRFDLTDRTLVDEEMIRQLDGVMGIQYAKEQLQIVLGTSVHKYYEILMQMLELNEDAVPAVQENEKKKDFITWFMDMVSGVFGPIVPAIAGAGMIKGLMGGLVALGVISNATDTYKVIDMLASGVFTFLPFFIAASAAKKFKTNQYLAIAMASIIMYPTMVDAAKAGEISSFLFGGMLPIPVFNYSGSVIPIIFAVFALSYIYKWVDKIVPEAARTVVTPTLTIFISGFFTLTVIGPVGIYMGKALAWVLDTMFGISPILAGFIMGLIRPASILVGMHHAMTPIALENFATKGWDMLMPMMFIANLAIVGAACGCYFKETTQKDKSIVLSAVLSGILGITEPALFGVLTKYKKGFLAATIASCVGSMFIGGFGVRLYGYITSSVFSIPAYIGPYFVWAALGWIITVALSFTLSYLFVVKMDRK
ncbi:MAG: PTS transporter subunit EIIC [Eubacteriales bacterium]|nr:PTS transporter subunit EIIC [Eubacteriales bacterium]